MPSEVNPFRSDLDFSQCIQRAFNEDRDRIRVDAEISASIIAPPGLEVSIDSVDDSILVVGTEDATKTGIQHVLKVHSDGSIDVNAVISGSPNVNLFQVGGIATAVNNGTANNGTQRVTIASDNTPFSVNSIQSGVWTVAVNNFPPDADSLIQGSTTSGQLGSLIMGATTTNAPSYTNLTTNPLSLDTSGLLRVSLKDSPTNTNKFLVTVDPITFASPQHVILDSGTLTTITNPVTVVNSGTFAVQATQSGTWTTGRTWTLSSGTDSVAAVQSGTWNINNITGTISLPTGAATEATLVKLTLAQGSTTSGEFGPLVQGAVTTSAPTYITGQTDPLSLTTSGALRVDGSGTTQPVSGTVTVNQGTSPWIISGTVTTSTSNDTNYGTVGANTLRTAAQIGNSTGAADFNAGTTGAQTLRVTANAGINLNTSALALDTTVSALQVAQSSSTSGERGTLIQGAVTTAAPTYVTGNTNPLSLTTSGALRTDSSATTQPISGSVSVSNFPADADALAQGSTTAGQLGALIMGAVTTAAPGYTTAQTSPLSLTTTGLLRVDGSGVTQPISGAISFTAPQHVILDSGTLTSITNAVTVNQGTSPWVISGAVTLPYDTNYGTVGATTLRTAAEIGNATGAANFNYGAIGAQSLRVASQIGNATGAADFNAGATGAQTLRVASNLYDSSGTGITSTLVNSKQRLDTTLSSAGPVSPGAAAFQSNLAAGVFNTVLPTLTNTQQAALQLDSSGRLITVSSNFPTTLDTNYGTVGANTLRSAAQIGNATGASDFNAGTTGAQTLRVTSNITRNGTELDYNFGAASANTLRVAGLIGNSTGAADFNAGATGAQTLRVTANQGTSPWVVSGTVAVSNFPAYDTNYGTVGANTLRSAAQIGNATGAANFGAGATGAQTLRTSANLSDGAGTALTSTLFNSKQSLDIRTNDGFSTGSNTTPAITNVSSVVLAANTNRRYVYIFNQTGGTIFIKLGAAAVINTGYRLANNEKYEITANNLWTGTINAIKTGAAAANLDVFEGTI